MSLEGHVRSHGHGELGDRRLHRHIGDQEGRHVQYAPLEPCRQHGPLHRGIHGAGRRHDGNLRLDPQDRRCRRAWHSCLSDVLPRARGGGYLGHHTHLGMLGHRHAPDKYPCLWPIAYGAAGSRCMSCRYRGDCHIVFGSPTSHRPEGWHAASIMPYRRSSSQPSSTVRLMRL